MSDIKCPFCQHELNDNYYLCCNNPHCNRTSDMSGTEELWQELIRTRKALDVAVDALKLLKEKAYLTEYAQGVVAKALNKITALEQKV